MYGIAWSEILHSGMRADFHYPNFDSNFKRDEYRLLSLSRQPRIWRFGISNSGART